MKAAIRSIGAVSVLCLIVSPALAEQKELSDVKTITNSLGMKMVRIEPGQFLMGSGPDEKGSEEDESPKHKVTLTKGFYLGATEVTQQQWEKLMGPGPWTSNRNIAKGDKMPAVMMTWTQAGEFCKKLSEKEGRRYRLPTEAEWEYACRAGTKTWFYWGNEFDERYAWSNRNSERGMHEVAARLPNAWGLFDMGGNVWEWCSDWHEPHSAEESTDPNGPPEGEKKVIRSGSYSNHPYDCRSAERGMVPPETRGGSIGLRVVLEPPPPLSGRIPDNTIVHIGHSANLLKMGGRVFVFDCPAGTRAFADIMAKPDINDLADETVYVFASHQHGDHHNSGVFRWKERVASIEYVLSSDITRRPEDAVIVAPGDVVELDGMKIRGYPSTDSGVAYSIYAGGRHIYFAGDNGFWNWKGEKREQDYIDKALATVDRTVPMDIAFQVCDPDAAGVGDGGVGIFATTFQPRLLVPLHTRGKYEYLGEIARQLKDRGFKGRFWAIKKPGDSFSLE